MFCCLIHRMYWQRFVFRNLMSYQEIKWSGPMKMVSSWSHLVPYTCKEVSFCFQVWHKFRQTEPFALPMYRAWETDDKVLFEIQHNEKYYAGTCRLQYGRCSTHCLPGWRSFLYVSSICWHYLEMNLKGVKVTVYFLGLEGIQLRRNEKKLSPMVVMRGVVWLVQGWSSVMEEFKGGHQMLGRTHWRLIA